MTTPSQGIPEPLAMQELRARLAHLPARFGVHEVTLVPVYNHHYDSVSIGCEGGTLAQQQQLIRRLAQLSPQGLQPEYVQAPFAYPDTSNPQLNFNHVTDALNLLKYHDYAARAMHAPTAMRGRQ